MYVNHILILVVTWTLCANIIDMFHELFNLIILQPTIQEANKQNNE